MSRFPLPRLSLAISLVALASAGLASPSIPAEYRIGGFAIGPQAYSFRFFSLFEAIEKTQQTGGKVIELGTRQKVSSTRPEIFNHDSPDELVRLVQEKLKKHDIRAVNYGVVAIPENEAGARKVFDFARKMEFYAIITKSVGSLDLIEKLVKEYDIKVGFHQHARRDNEPDYKIWEPAYVRDLLQNRDQRIGACADVGHWQTSGIRALDGLKLLSGRIISLHLKERAALGPGNLDQVFGTGITNVGAILTELRRQKFEGNIAIEYENNWYQSVPDIAQCIGFVRGWSAANPP